MRFLYACFKGYIGFYNGMNLDTVEIDFTKCKNNIVLIHGENGCGKSTLLNALTPFPDPSTAFVPNKNAEKIIRLFDSGDYYDLRIISPTDNKGGRKQSKAFVQKNGVELNENGNITSYKDIIFSEFEMDSNYNSLTKLSFNDRGLGDKTPAERKKFASSIVDNLETYNEIFKTLNKKSLIFKSHINTLHTKIQNIGSKENLEGTLKTLKQRNDSISSEVMRLNNLIVELQTRYSINNEEAKEIQNLKQRESELSTLLSKIQNDIILFKRKVKIDESEIENQYLLDKNLKIEYESNQKELLSKWKSNSERLRSLSLSINDLKVNNEMYGTIDLHLEEEYNNSLSKLNNLKSEINKLGFEFDPELIPKLNSLLDFYNRFIKRIDLFYDNIAIDDLDYLINKYNPNLSQELSNKLNSNFDLINSTQTELSELQIKLKSISILDNRPSKCNINTCPFISEALVLKSENIDIIDQIDALQTKLLHLSEDSTKIQKMIEICNFRDHKMTELGSIINDIIDNSANLKIFKDKIYDIDIFKSMIGNNSLFQLQRDPKEYIYLLNLLKSYEAENNSFQVISVEYRSMKDKLDIKIKNEESIKRLTTELEEVTSIVSNSKLDLDKYNSLLESLNIKLDLESQYYDLYLKFKSIKNELEPIQNKIHLIEEKSSDALKSAGQIYNYQNGIQRLNKELEPIVRDIQKISGQLVMLDSYYQEYELYKTKFNMIETLKKYCSPTGGGIQTIFMQLYMSKTLELANQILGMLFNGEYQLLDFVINQNEFRIPFVGSGLPVDDISSGSASQICIMGLAINLALFHQASTKFNIARLDEVDAVLSNKNKLEFTNVLYRTLPLLNIEQLFIISHSLEVDSSFADIIKLKSFNDYDSATMSGNVIYDYSEEIKKTF